MTTSSNPSALKCLVWNLVLLFRTMGTVSGLKNLPQPCDNQIYCTGGENSLLHTVQMASVYEDSKTFVDKPLKGSPKQVLANFDTMMKAHGNTPGKAAIEKFVADNFEDEGTEFEDWQPSDWSEEIPLFQLVSDPHYRNMSKILHSKWLDLGRSIKRDVKDNPQGYSLIYLENPFIVPGGRFRECYYWDTYWTILGLIVSKMHDTVKGMLENFVSLINQYGMIPNGNRVYYTRRSQPPLFIPMVYAYYEETNDIGFVRENIEAMRKEFEFWVEHRTTKVEFEGEEYVAARYQVEVDGPRPESYREDFNDAHRYFTEAEDYQDFYINMKSGAESGLDYSSKWFIPDGEDGKQYSSNLRDIDTRNILPVELNAYLCKNARILSDFYSILGDSELADQHEHWRRSFQDTLERVMWNDTQGMWFDYDLKSLRQRSDRHHIYPTSFAPLWADCYRQTRHMEKIKKVVQFMDDQKLTSYIGIPTSFVLESKQQWDSMNTWPPMQELVVTGLLNSGYEPAQYKALEIAKKWVKNGYVALQQTIQVSGQPNFYEKYNAAKAGSPGSGGEYKVQEGFGWTNGVFLYFLELYSDELSFEDRLGGASSSANGIHHIPYILVASLAAASIQKYFQIFGVVV